MYAKKFHNAPSESKIILRTPPPLSPRKKILDRACKKNDLRLSLVNIIKLYA